MQQLKQQLTKTQPAGGSPEGEGNGKAKRVLTDEENVEYMRQLFDAIKAHDKDEMRRLGSLVQYPARRLRVLKHFEGADYIREMNYDTTLADIEYGDDWLERDIGI